MDDEEVEYYSERLRALGFKLLGREIYGDYEPAKYMGDIPGPKKTVEGESLERCIKIASKHFAVRYAGAEQDGQPMEFEILNDLYHN